MQQKGTKAFTGVVPFKKVQIRYHPSDSFCTENVEIHNCSPLQFK